MDLAAYCPINVVHEVQAADLRSSEASGLIGWAEVQAGRECALATVEAVARRLDAQSDLNVVDLFCNAVASYARMLSPEQKALIREAYLRIPYDPAISFNYFLGLRNARIDLRERLRGRIAEDWSFESPRRDAETWDYYLYLAAMGESGALDRLAEKIAATSNGNDATLLLLSLSELQADGVDEILRRYAEDTRTADGTTGPGLPIKENVRFWLMARNPR